MHTEYFALAFGSIYLILAERGIIKLPNEKRQREFERRMSNKWWRYSWLTLSYAALAFLVFLIVKNLYWH
jgi:hypothetical protein